MAFRRCAVGKGSIGNKPGYKTKRGYYCASDYDEKVGGKFWMFLEPLAGNDDELFFYVRKQGRDRYEVTGEGYIVTSRESLSRHIREVKNEVQGKVIWYYHLDENENIVRKEMGDEIQFGAGASRSDSAAVCT